MLSKSKLNAKFKQSNEVFDYIVKLKDEEKIIKKHGFQLFRGADGRLTNLLGKGTFGKVYKARKLSDNSEVACKVIPLCTSAEWKRDPSREMEFLNELRITLKLHHEHTIQYYGNIIVNNYSYSFMEIATGTFEELLNTIDQLSIEQTKAYFVQMVLAIGYLHRMGIAHRDLKLSNTLVTKDYFVDDVWLIKVSDFGTSALAFTNGRIQNDSEVCGTPVFMAPELLVLFFQKVASQFEDFEIQPVESFAADMWALGVCLYFILTREFPYELGLSRAQQLDIIGRQAKRQYWPLKRPISSELRDLIDSLFEYERFARITIHGVERHPWLAVWEEKIVNNLRNIVTE